MSLFHFGLVADAGIHRDDRADAQVLRSKSPTELSKSCDDRALVSSRPVAYDRHIFAYSGWTWILMGPRPGVPFHVEVYRYLDLSRPPMDKKKAAPIRATIACSGVGDTVSASTSRDAN